MTPPKHPARSKKRDRPDRYESQLTPEEVEQLRTDLLGSKKSLRKIAGELPRWRSGPKKDRKVTISTLGNIRNRMMAEEDLIAAEEMTDKLIGKMAENNPHLTPEDLEAAGMKLFTTLAIQNRDPEVFVKLVRARKESTSTRLDEKRFMRETAELFIKWVVDDAAKKIALGDGSNAEKIEALGKHMFAEDWEK